ncbi:MAG: efflux RND transporter periplasmic adaptor subunit [Acidobacteriota bacterium]|nr:efflux RND transporter periplasmic adaptor subunit [Acidobacteriota bacterium]
MTAAGLSTFVRWLERHAARRLPLVGLLVLAGGVAAVLLLRTPSAPVAAGTGPALPPNTVRLDRAAQQNAGVTVGTVRTETRTSQLEAPGLVALDETRTARIGSLVEGIVTSVFLEIGDRVMAGQRLADLHSHIVHDAWAAYRKALAERRRQTTEVAYAVEAEQRASRLYAARAIPLQEVQRARADRVAAEEALDVARTEVRRAEEELQHYGITSGEDPTGEAGEQIPVRTPIAGVVLDRMVTQGTAVTPGAPLFVVSDLSTLWALAEIDETRLSRVAVGRPVAVRVAAYPDETFAGRITFIADTVNPKTRRVSVRCEVPNPDGRLKPEMYATIALGAGDPRTVLVVPEDAVQMLDGHPAVFVADGPDRFRAQVVTTGATADGRIEITEGLAPGQSIVTAGAFLLKSELLKASAPTEG